MAGLLKDFCVGDRVQMVNNRDCDNNLPCNGSEGTILAIREELRRLGVCWDEANEDNFHSLGGKCEYGYGWWVPPESCEVIEAGDCEVNPPSADALFSMLGI